MLHAIIFAIGLGLGGVIVWVLTKTNEQKPSGVLYFYDAGPGEPPAMLTELDATPEEIGKLDRVIFTVSHK